MLHLLAPSRASTVMQRIVTSSYSCMGSAIEALLFNLTIELTAANDPRSPNHSYASQNTLTQIEFECYLRFPKQVLGKSPLVATTQLPTFAQISYTNLYGNTNITTISAPSGFRGETAIMHIQISTTIQNAILLRNNVHIQKQTRIQNALLRNNAQFHNLTLKRWTPSSGIQ